MVFGYRIQSSIREDDSCRENGFWEYRKIRKKIKFLTLSPPPQKSIFVQESPNELKFIGYVGGIM